MWDTLREISLAWYELISRVGYGLGGPVGRLALAVNIPTVSAFLFGLVGSLAPCQMSANSGAIAHLAHRAGQDRRSIWRESGGYLLGKALVYTLLGGTAILLGLQVPTAAMVVLRKVFGPMMILIGLYMLRIVRFRFSIGDRLAAWLERRLPGRAGAGSFLLGAAYSLSFCPTMALLFFGLLVPLGVRTPGPVGLMLPTLFAVGTALPLLLFAAFLDLGIGLVGDWNRRVRRWDGYVRVAAGIVFLLAGSNDVLLYWWD